MTRRPPEATSSAPELRTPVPGPRAGLPGRLGGVAAAAGLLALACGCGKVSARTAAEPPPDPGPPAAAAPLDLDAVLRAVAAPRRPLGAHRLRGKASLILTDGPQVLEELHEQTLVEQGPGGELHARYESSRDQARELIAAEGMVYLRPGFGKFHRRAPVDPDEATRVAGEIAGALGADLELVAGHAAVAEGGRTSLLGRQAHRVVLSLGEPRPRAPHTGPRAWRDAAEVSALSGELTVDDRTGAVLAGALDARVAFQRGDRHLVLSVRASLETFDLGGAVVITAPPFGDAVDSPGRAPELEDRAELLSGLAPPAGRGPR